MNKKAAEAAEQLRSRWTGPMSESEVAFLRDVQGFIEFAIRNGLNFQMIMSGLVHDFNEIARDGFEYDTARSRGFLPKVAGYSKLTSDDFGGGEEEQPAS